MSEREIKFRVWDRIDKEMKECALLRWYDGQNLGRIAGYWNDGRRNGWTDSEPNFRYDLMQFVGLSDCDGKEIYESDVIRHLKYDKVLAVVWNQDGCSWNLGTMALSNLCVPNLKVIGNIHENPELLKS